MGYSINEFTYDGDPQFDLTFALGWTQDTTIEAYLLKDTQVNVEFDFVNSSRVQIDTTDVEVGDVIRFTRTVSKSAVPYDFGLSPGYSGDELQAALLHSIYLQHEILDGRIGDVADVTDSVRVAIESAVSSALQSFSAEYFLTHAYEQSFVMDGAKEFSLSGDYTFTPEEVEVVVKNPPGINVEVLMDNGNGVVFSFIVTPAGSVTIAQTEDIQLTSGSLTLTSANYTSGMELSIALPLRNGTEFSLGFDYPDYAQAIVDIVEA